MNYSELLYENYKEALKSFADFPLMDKEQFAEYASVQLKDMDCIIIENDGQTGFMFYETIEDEDALHCYIPACGCYAESGQMITRLFSKLAEGIVRDKPVHFSVRLFAGNTDWIEAFHMMQFGTMAETCVKKLETAPEEMTLPYDIKVLSKPELEEKWDSVWAAVHGIVAHLQGSPVFYPGTEFTEEVYRGFFMDEGVEVIGAFDRGTLVGIIEWNREADSLLCGEKSVNVGEAYVKPSLRGNGLAEALLKTAEKNAKSAGADLMWVEHGTANPNARGFWNKYFKTYKYELVRTVEPVRI